MTRRIGGEARAAVIRAQAQARRLGQAFIGCEHLLYGVAGADDAVGDVLRARGVTPERVEEQVARLIARGRGAARRPITLDAGALEAIGVDLDAVRDRVEEAFGPGALDRPASVRGGHLRVTREARKCLTRPLRAAGTDPADAHGTERITLTLLAMNASAPRGILAALGVSAEQLAAEISGALPSD